MPFRLSPPPPIPLATLPPADERSDRKGRLPVIVVVAVGLLGTALLTWGSYSQSRREHAHHETSAADLVYAALQRQLANSESLVRALAGLERASEEVTLAELRRFVSAMESGGPALEGIGTLGYATAASGGDCQER